MRISDYLSEGFVVAHLRARDMAGVVREVASRAATAGIGSETVIAEKLLEREQAYSTVMGEGLAVPHATVPGIPGPVIGVARSDEPIAFGPPEADPVHVFLVLLSPPGHERVHVKLLARICRLARDADFISKLSEADDARTIVEVIETIDAQHP